MRRRRRLIVTFQAVATRRFSDRPRTRKPGAGRPRKTARTDDGPVDVEIVGAAARLFARQGVAATSMAEIAQSVGLGVSSLYYYFGNKHEVLERIVEEVNRVPLAIATEVVEFFDDAPRQLHAFIRNDAAALCEFPFDINEVHRLAGDDRTMFATYWADRQQLVDSVEAIVKQGISAGDFQVVDAPLCSLSILANDEAAQNWYRVPSASGIDRSPDEVGTFVADLAVRGLLVDTNRIDEIRADTTAFVRLPVTLR